MRRYVLLFLFAAIILSLQGNSGCQEQGNRTHPPEYVLNEIIVKFSPDAFNEEGVLVSGSIISLNTKYGMVSMEPLFKGVTSGDLAYIYILKFPEEINVLEAMEKYKNDPSVIYAEPNYIVHAIKEGSNAD